MHAYLSLVTMDQDWVVSLVQDYAHSLRDLVKWDYKLSNQLLCSHIAGLICTDYATHLQQRVPYSRQYRFGYVEFQTLDGLKKALELNNGQLAGRNVRVSVADPRKLFMLYIYSRILSHDT